MFEIMIIGAGPAGISMAVEARRSGINQDKILLLEKSDNHSWSIRRFYPEKKLVTANYKGNDAVCSGVMCIDDSTKNETLSYLDHAIEKYNLQVHYGESVYKIEKKQDTFFEIITDKATYQSKVCVIAIGILGKPNRPRYVIPAAIKNKVHFDITSTEIKNQKVLVVGGGDSASEYVQYLIQEGNEVSLSYRGDSFLRMNEINRNSLLALKEQGKIQIYLQSNIESLDSNENSRPIVNFQEVHLGSEDFDHVILALGGSTPKNFLSLLGIEFEGNEPVVKEGYETSVKGLFLIGDLSAGKKGGSIISAFNSSRVAIQKICDDYLGCKVGF